MRSSDIQFGVTIAGLAGLGWWLFGWEVATVVGCLLLAGVIWKSFRLAFMRVFHAVMSKIGQVQVGIFMGVVYGLVLLPTAFFYQRKRSRLPSPGGSTFRERNHVFSSSDVENPW